VIVCFWCVVGLCDVLAVLFFLLLLECFLGDVFVFV